MVSMCGEDKARIRRGSLRQQLSSAGAAGPRGRDYQLGLRLEGLPLIPQGSPQTPPYQTAQPAWSHPSGAQPSCLLLASEEGHLLHLRKRAGVPPFGGGLWVSPALSLSPLFSFFASCLYSPWPLIPFITFAPQTACR